MNVVITGSSSGLGHALVGEFIFGKHDVIGSTNEDRLVTDTQRYLNLSVSRSIDVFAELLPWDKIDLLINCAGINGIQQFEDLDMAFLHMLMDVNCFGPVLLTRKLLPKLRGGVVINIISDAAWRPMRHSLAYNCSKAAFDMATKQMARELTKPYDLTVIGIRPGKMSGTGMSKYIDEQVQVLRKWTPEQAQEYYRNNSVTGLEAQPAFVSNLIYQIATSPLVKTMSGSCLDLVG